MSFRRYDHVERLGHEKVEGITIGDVYVFPKLDGTNASVWFDTPEPGGAGHCSMTPSFTIGCGSRTRTLSAEADNAGFHAWVEEEQQRFNEVAKSGGMNWTIYGEWLVPHTLKTYRQEAWRRFYVFDVYDNIKHKYLSYEEYEPTIKSAGLDVIEPLCIFTNPSDAQLQHEVEQNSYLILDGAGAGEGIVLKNYAWSNKHCETPWAKLVRNEFKEENKRAFGTLEKGGEFQVEAAIAEEFVTQFLVEKERMKIMQSLADDDIAAGVEVRPVPSNDERFFDEFEAIYQRVQERHRAKMIPRLLGTVFHALVTEEMWMALKKHKFPTVDFKRLRQHSIYQTKKYASDLF
jgi:hypothetical protein